ncbi:MAG: hypothetical protein ABI794_09450 [Betaproteobacteria bacterium]
MNTVRHRPASRFARVVVGVLFAVATSAQAAGEHVRVAVIGGVKMCGVWDHLAPRIEAATGFVIDTVAAAPKEGVVPVFRHGDADLLLIHGSDESLALAYKSISGPLRVWGANEHVIVGPDDDPAHVAEATSGADALRRIAEAKAPMVAFRDPGSHGVLQRLLRHSGVEPSADWLIVDTLPDVHDVLRFASERHAYVIVGHIPVAFWKLRGEGMRVLLKGDPSMRRPYVVLEPGPRHPADDAARGRARIVADFLVSPAGQAALRAADHEAGGPWVFPLP